MRCEQCRRNKVESLMNYGGMALCPSCYDYHNPLLQTVTLMPKETRERLEEKKWQLEKQLRELNHALEIDSKIKKSGATSITLRTFRN